jgi:U3 small nucleolar RNA-associated protein 14
MPKNGRKQRQQQKPRIVEDVEDSEDEEIDEDEAFNSDDERKYGSFFSSKRESMGNEDIDESEDDAIDSADDDNDDDEDDEGDGGEYMMDLLNKLNPAPEAKEKGSNAAALVDESEFAASVLKSEQLTIDDLMSGLSDTKGFGVMQKVFKEVAKGKTTAAPVAKVVSDRAQRKVAYEHSTDDVTGWLEAVQQNRQAETLDFRPKERPDVLTKNQLVDKFEPTTEFEKELAAALHEAGQQDEEAMQRMEEELLRADDLGSNELTLEEYQKRRSQLAKMRALMFYHEQKRHHINKIKSKKYRRIRKKQRERLKESDTSAQLEEDPDLVREMEEKEEIERMRERMTLAHKNTSKWAKRVLKRGKNVDVDTRRALSAQLARGDALRRKMDSTTAGENESDDDDDNEDLVEMARRALADADSNAAGIMKSTGLFQLSFMQKGIEKQRERAKQEARQLLRELEANEREMDSSAEEEETQLQPKKKKKKVASADDMKGVMESGKMVASSLTFGSSNTISIDGGINIDIGSLSQPRKSDETTATKTIATEHASTFDVAESGSNVAAVPPEENVNRQQFVEKSGGKGSEIPLNPWLAAPGDLTKEKNKSKRSRYNGIDRRGIIDVDGAACILADEPVANAATAPADSAASRQDKSIILLSQEELIRRAFVAPTEQEVDDEFLKEKAEAEERDDPIRKKEASANTAMGWGSWAGQGAPAPRPARKLPKHLQPPEKKAPKRSRLDEKKPNVIIIEKRLKKTANSFQVAHIPYPYKSREEYEKAMSGGLGKEWNVSSGVKNLTRPDVLTRAGKVIQPISKRAKQQRTAAKF